MKVYSLNSVCDHIMIAHSLPDPFFGPAQGMHGATLSVEVTWRRLELSAQSVVMDIGDATSMLGETLDSLRYQNLDDHPDFVERLSTTEAIARHISDKLRERFDESEFSGLRVLLREHPGAWASDDVDLRLSRPRAWTAHSWYLAIFPAPRRHALQPRGDRSVGRRRAPRAGASDPRAVASAPTC